MNSTNETNELNKRNQKEGFKTLSINRYDLKADEFMLMCLNEQNVQFKHRNTRNYVYLIKHNQQLYVPETNRPWNQGFFDKME